MHPWHVRELFVCMSSGAGEAESYRRWMVSVLWAFGSWGAGVGWDAAVHYWCWMSEHHLKANTATTPNNNNNNHHNNNKNNNNNNKNNNSDNKDNNNNNNWSYFRYKVDSFFLSICNFATRTVWARLPSLFWQEKWVKLGSQMFISVWLVLLRNCWTFPAQATPQADIWLSGKDRSPISLPCVSVCAIMSRSYRMAMTLFQPLPTAAQLKLIDIIFAFKIKTSYW